MPCSAHTFLQTEEMVQRFLYKELNSLYLMTTKDEKKIKLDKQCLMSYTSLKPVKPVLN